MTWFAPNTSQGFHDEMKEAWDRLCPEPKHVLLVGEGKACADHFSEAYPSWIVTSANSDSDLEPHICTDLCKPGWIEKELYDLIINQANLEHMYDPFGCVQETMKGLRVGGINIMHTVCPIAGYHAYPRDYFRFFGDWFADIPGLLDTQVEMVWLLTKPSENPEHIFAAYRRIG